MIGLKRAPVALSVVAALAVLGGPDALADTVAVSSLDFTAEKGAFPVSDTGGHWAAPAADVEIWENQNVIKIDATPDGGFHYIRVELTGPNAVPLRVATYSNVGDRQQHPELADVLVISQGLGCHAADGKITVDRIERNQAAKLIAFDGSVEQRCSGAGTPTLRGEIHFHI